MPTIRCLNDKGIAEFESFLERLKLDRNLATPSNLLIDSRYSVEFPYGEVDVERRHFENRLDFAKYLDGRIREAGIEANVDARGIWEWLSIFYFDEVFPRSNDVGINPKRYVTSRLKGSLSYRHLLRDPYILYRQHRHSNGGELDLLLCDELWRFSDVVEQLAARTRLRNSPGALQVARLLYFDPVSGKPKRGARQGDGGYRRFCQYLQNLSPQFDLTKMSADTIMAFLPIAFDRWIDDAEIRLENTKARDLFGFQGIEIEPMPPITELADVLTDLDTRAVSQRQVKIRSDAFRFGVLKAYYSRCCISGIGLVHTAYDYTEMYEVHAAHIIPVSEHGTDVIQNGLALSRTLHWAFDLGMVWIDSDMRVNVANEVQSDRRNEWLRSFEGRSLRLPEDARLHPSSDALRWHVENVVRH